MSYLSQYSTRRTPQSEPLPAQVKNSAGGHSYAVDDWARLRRFLILGAEGGTYYIGQRELVRENAQAVQACITQDGVRAVREIVSISREGRAPKNDPAVFALALAASADDAETRKIALACLSDVCRIGTHLFTFAGYVENFRGWGRGLRSAVAQWYERDDLAYQLVKYRQRNGWTHRDMLRLAHPEPSPLLAWAAGKDSTELELPALIAAYERAQMAEKPRDTVAVIRDCPDLPREALNPDHLTSPDVWEALLDAGMPMTALIRNLATMTRIGLVKPMSNATMKVCEQISDSERLRKARVHPLAVLVALKTYQQGYSARGSNAWHPVGAVADALDGAFYAAFGNVQPTNKRTMLNLDVSGSMGVHEIAGMPGISPRVGSVAMALVTAAVEPMRMLCGFSTSFVSLDEITPRMRLDDAIARVSRLPFGGTDCALPMMAALHNKLEIDTFIIYTDSETWHGRIHPVQALREYRQKTGINAKLVVVGMVSNGFTIADPSDLGMLDVVGFDTATPNVISEFAIA